MGARVLLLLPFSRGKTNAIKTRSRSLSLGSELRRVDGLVIRTTPLMIPLCSRSFARAILSFFYRDTLTSYLGKLEKILLGFRRGAITQAILRFLWG